jgi:hypothetical protein
MDEFQGVPEFDRDEEGYPIIRRPTITIPREIANEFIRDMEEEVRQSPGELVTAILIRYYRAKRLEKVAARPRIKEEPANEDHRIPDYGAKPSKLAAGQQEEQTGIQ